MPGSCYRCRGGGWERPLAGTSKSPELTAAPTGTGFPLASDPPELDPTLPPGVLAPACTCTHPHGRASKVRIQA